MIYVKRGPGPAVPGFAAAQIGMTPATRIQICGPYHGSDSLSETTHTRHHRSTPGTDTLFRPRKTSSAMLTESSPIRRPPPDLPSLHLACLRVLISPSPSVSRGGPPPPRASVIDGRDLATVSTARGRPKSISTIVVSWAGSCTCVVECYVFPQPVSAPREGHTPHLSHVTAFYAREPSHGKKHEAARMVELDIRRVCGPRLVTPRSGRPVLEVKVYLWESLSCGSFIWPVSGSQPWRAMFRNSHRAVLLRHEFASSCLLVRSEP